MTSRFKSVGRHKNAVAIVIAGTLAAAGWVKAAPGPAPLDHDDFAIVHVLNRIGFGPRPGDIAAVRGIGISAYIERQLYPERIDDAAVDARLQDFRTLSLGSRDIAATYERPLLEARRERKQQASSGDGDAVAKTVDRAVQREANLPMIELAQQKLIRAAFSERQLQEVLTDFWFNHFNVDARKGPSRFFLTEYERDTIRPHVLDHFRDLLGATAKSPAMLFYLDNWLSADPARAQAGPPVRRPGRRPGGARARQPQAQAQKAPRGLNENYGRELMELHTLGVDGGYTQQDVTETARAFTGWTIDRPLQGGGFRFEPRIHDDGVKVVLGHRITAGGIHDGEAVLDILARHPATARFIASKLTRRLVGDDPPPALVDRVAARFSATDGDLREVVRTILTSPEFLAPDSYRAKTKTPFEFVVSAVRATGTSIVNAAPLVRQLQELGMPLYQCQAPTGYRDTADAWTNTGALVARMNFALALTTGELPGIQFAAEGLPSTVGDDMLTRDLSVNTRQTIERATTVPQRLALTLGSPEFQKK
jgi:uncharacterized protein (DUF1800 family)